MPWRAEQEDEERKKQKKARHEVEVKQTSMMKWMNPAKFKDDATAAKVVSKEEEKYQEHKFGCDDDDIAKASRVIKVKEVQKIKFSEYTQNVQAILINPKWRRQTFEEMNLDAGADASNIGDKSTSSKTNDENDSDSDKEATPTGVKPPNSPNSKAGGGTTSPQRANAQAFKGITMAEFSQLIIPKQLMQDGILFIWLEKEYIMEVAKVLEGQEFYYVENMCWVMLDKVWAEGKYFTHCD